MLAFRLASENVILDVFDTPYKLSLTEINCSNSKLIECSLTIIEGELLFLLLVDKQATRELCESVLWKGRVVSDSSRSLTQVVSTLRKKLRLFGIEDFILTQPRLGYVLSNEFDVVDAAKVLNTNDLKNCTAQTIQPESKVLNEMSIDHLEVCYPGRKIIRHYINKFRVYELRFITSSVVFLVSLLMTLSVSFYWYIYDHKYTEYPIVNYKQSSYDKRSEAINSSYDFKIKNNVIGFDHNRVFLWRKTINGWVGVITTKAKYIRDSQIVI